MQNFLKILEKDKPLSVSGCMSKRLETFQSLESGRLCVAVWESLFW